MEFTSECTIFVIISSKVGRFESSSCGYEGRGLNDHHVVAMSDTHAMWIAMMEAVDIYV